MRARILLLAALAVLGTGTVWAQRIDDMTLAAQAYNRGIFVCAVDVAIFNFGDVNADGVDFGTPDVTPLGRNGTDDGGRYETAPGAIEWTCRAAPSSTVDLALNSTATDHLGGMDPDNLEARIQATAGGASTGFNFFTSQNDLITNMAVGNGALAAAGDLDLRLSILDDDPLGTEIWVVRLRANGSP